MGLVIRIYKIKKGFKRQPLSKIEPNIVHIGKDEAVEQIMYFGNTWDVFEYFKNRVVDGWCTATLEDLENIDKKINIRTLPLGFDYYDELTNCKPNDKFIVHMSW